MRFYIILGGTLILALGGAGWHLLDAPHSIGFLQGALTLGGGIVICGIFSVQMPWHGFIGAGVLSLLGAARGLANLPGLLKFFTGDQPRGATPLLELGATLISIVLLLKIIQALSRERLRRMLEFEE